MARLGLRRRHVPRAHPPAIPTERRGEDLRNPFEGEGRRKGDSSSFSLPSRCLLPCLVCCLHLCLLSVSDTPFFPLLVPSKPIKVTRLAPLPGSPRRGWVPDGSTRFVAIESPSLFGPRARSVPGAHVNRTTRPWHLSVATPQGADVLEVGAGCGVVGFLAARLGARRVTFTDYLPGLLSNLDQSVELNRESCPGTEFRVRHLEWLSAAPELLLEHSATRPMVRRAESRVPCPSALFF